MEWGSARRVAASYGTPGSPVDVPLAEALGYALAGPLTALVPSPSYDSSAMDGYAVAGPGPWRVVGRVLAGDPTPGAAGPAEPGTPPGHGARTAGTGVLFEPDALIPQSVTAAEPGARIPQPGVRILPPGTAVEIATGAVVPPGADAVLPYEDAVVLPGDGMKIESRPVGETGREGRAHGGRHIRRTGEDYPAGTVLLAEGTALTPAALALAAATGYDTVRVRPRPRVGVIVTGREVRASGLPEPGRVRDAIGPLLPGLIARAGGHPRFGTRLGDDRAALAEALRDKGSDVVVVCGATSVGAADHLRAALKDVDASVLVSGVACRPGHPQLFAALPDGRAVVGLPGNPFAALVAAVTLLVPVVERLAGRAPRRPRTARGRDLPSHPRDTRVVPVRYDGDGVVPVGHDRPGTLWGAALADALAVVPPRWDGDTPVELLSSG
ncbi:molybdopterin molybdenumtransferase MoeA [Virgisporangium aliadipatigenens]|uniref:Molybdopterin molybdenumtransferase n=1 Tax=Virgisporangium aliadipatigenens TaxID=741659 RepID=A0A8J3YJT3_9ACTN|nr:molybdopterin molybdotransferase MoeA [Virgisporangium aliadipatigenens]GIJ45423.1 molybdopterin molybdenumtransferase MoeA [Virgisporangium aliadipatigenens]